MRARTINKPNTSVSQLEAYWRNVLPLIKGTRVTLYRTDSPLSKNGYMVFDGQFAVEQGEFLLNLHTNIELVIVNEEEPWLVEGYPPD